MQKNTISKTIQTFLLKKTTWRRNRYKEEKQNRLTNTNPTIICNSCVCGTIYRDLNLQYMSPTTDILIYAKDFFVLLQDLDYYLHCSVEEIFLEGISYPVGVLKRGDEQVVLRFLHEHSFQEAKEKWERRCKRVDLNNVCIIYHQKACSQHLLVRKSNPYYRKFKELPYHNKRMISNVLLSFDKELVALSKAVFHKKKTVLEYPSAYSKKRLMDQFDYVSFLNQNKK